RKRSRQPSSEAPKDKGKRRRRSRSSRSHSRSGSHSSPGSSSDSETASIGSHPSIDEGKTNTESYSALSYPEEVGKMAGRYDNLKLWWFTPTTGQMNHDRERIQVSMGNSLSITAKTKLTVPPEFQEDVDLSREDWDFAIDGWIRCMAKNGVPESSTSQWTAFNNQCKASDDRHLLVNQKALQRLHQHQREIWCAKAREAMKAREKLKKKSSKMSPEEVKQLKEATRLFNPAVWPAAKLAEIKQKMNDERSEQLRLQVERGTGGASSSSQRGSSRNHQPGPSSDRRRKGKHYFRADGTDGNQASSSRSADRSLEYKACCMCGSRETGHRPKSCSASTLAYSPSHPTICKRGGTDGKLILPKSGGTGYCLGHNTGACTWTDCRLAHQCSLCGSDKCAAQTCPLSR
ncbi:hypothetical protein V8E36_007267, partial [Tilletia maclaganii]